MRPGPQPRKSVAKSGPPATRGSRRVTIMSALPRPRALRGMAAALALAASAALALTCEGAALAASPGKAMPGIGTVTKVTWHKLPTVNGWHSYNGEPAAWAVKNGITYLTGQVYQS